MVNLFPDGEVKFCRNNTANPSSITFRCEIEHSALVWIFIYGQEDTSKVVRFVYGHTNSPVYPTVGTKAAIISESKNKMSSGFLVSISEGIIPFTLSCGINFDKYKTFKLAYEGK